MASVSHRFMEILDLRQLRSRALEALLEEEKTIWQTCLQWDYSATAALILRFVDARALAGYAAVEEGRAVGYSFYVYEDYKGLIGNVFVSNSFRNGTTEVRLLTHVIETLQATPGVRRIETQLMNFGDKPIRDCFLAAEFQSYERKFLFLPLADCPPLSPPRDSELELAGWDSHWFAQAAQLITLSYHGHVDSAISDQYRSRAGAARFLDNIIRYPGCGVFDPDCSFLAFRGGIPSPCGMVLTSVVRKGVAHITQLCVAPESQGLGVGYRLICRTLQALQERRFQAVTLTVTASNSKALRLYERLRFSTLRDFYAFVWDAPAPEGRFVAETP